MRLFSRIAVPVLAVAVTAAIAIAGDPAAPVMLAPADMKWMPNPNATGVMTAVTWGDPAKGAHGAFHKFEPGFVAPLHTHTANLKIVVVSGTMSLTGKDGKEMKFPAGSFYTQPNTFAHVTKCLPGAECIGYVEADAAWDLKPVEVATKK